MSPTQTGGLAGGGARKPTAGWATTDLDAATQAAIAKATSAVQPAGLTKAAVGLGNVDNVSTAATVAATARMTGVSALGNVSGALGIDLSATNDNITFTASGGDVAVTFSNTVTADRDLVLDITADASQRTVTFPGGTAWVIPAGGTVELLARTKDSGVTWQVQQQTTPAATVSYWPLWHNASATRSALYGSASQIGYNNVADLANIAAPLSQFTQARLQIRVVTASTNAAGKVLLKYSTATITDLTGAPIQLGAAGDVACSTAATGVIDSGWVALAAGAIGDVYLHLLQVSTDGTTQPTLGRVDAWFK